MRHLFEKKINGKKNKKKNTSLLAITTKQSNRLEEMSAEDTNRSYLEGIDEYLTFRLWKTCVSVKR